MKTKKKKPYLDRISVVEAIRVRNEAGLSIGPGSLNRGRNADPDLHRAGICFFGNWQLAVEAAGFDYAHVLEQSKSRYPTADAVLDAIKDRSFKELPLTALDVSKRPGPHRDRALFDGAKRFFGSWGNAIEAAEINLQEVRPSRSCKYTDKASIVAAIQLRNEEGLPINYKAVHQGDDADSALLRTARSLFGSWSEALKAAGINFNAVVKSHRKKYPDKKCVVAEIQRRVSQNIPINYQAVSKDSSCRDKALINAASRYFGAWPEALDAAGIEGRRGPSWAKKYKDKEAVIAEIKRRHKAGIPINYQSIAKDKMLCDRGLHRSAHEFFDSWQQAVEAAGFNYQALVHDQRRKYPDAESVLAAILKREKDGVARSHMVVNIGTHRDKGLLYAAQREFGTWRKAIEAAGLAYPEPKNSTKNRMYPEAESVVTAIQQRNKEGMSLNYGDVEKGKDRNKPLLYAAQKIFDSWGNAVKAAGIAYDAKSPVRQVSKYKDSAAVTAEIQRRIQVGLPVSSKMIEAENCALRYGGRKFFGSWSAALQAAGVDPATVQQKRGRCCIRPRSN